MTTKQEYYALMIEEAFGVYPMELQLNTVNDAVVSIDYCTNLSEKLDKTTTPEAIATALRAKGGAPVYADLDLSAYANELPL